MDAASMLKPALARGELRLIGATTAGEYRRHIEKDAALERRFEPVRIAEPSVAATIAILRGLRPRYETHHDVRIDDDGAGAAAELSDRYVTDRFLPDKAIDLIDRASARARIGAGREAATAGVGAGRGDPAGGAHRAAAPGPRRGRRRRGVRARAAARPGSWRRPRPNWPRPPPARPWTTAWSRLTADDIAAAVAAATGIPVARLTDDRAAPAAATWRTLLHRRVVGQDDAVEAVADAVRAGRAGLAHPDRPVGSFLFLGPTGVGKTELARALAEALFGTPDALLRFDMSEYADRSSALRLIGAPPGHVGYDDAGQLTEAVRRTPYAVLLLDEIEKAHPDVTGTLLQVLDAGRLTDAHGPHRRLHQHGRDHDEQPRRRAVAGRGGVRAAGRGGPGLAADAGPAALPPGVPEPDRRGRAVPRPGPRRAAPDHRADAGRRPPAGCAPRASRCRPPTRRWTGWPSTATSPSSGPGRCAARSPARWTARCPD